MKEKSIFLLKIAGCLGASVAAGFLLLVLAYCIPTERMRQNVAASSEQVSSEGGYYQWAKGYKNAQTDTYTDASLFLNAMHPGSGQVVADAMNAPRLLYGDDNNEASVVLLAEEEAGEPHVVNYGRYWHGSLILLKPTLFFFDLADIRMFSMMIQMGLLFLVVAGFVQRKKSRVLPGFFVAVMMLNPVTMIMGFCFGIEYSLMLLAVAVMLFCHEKLEKGRNYYYFFLLSGILFVYFNELSFPVIGLGIPLAVYLLLSQESAGTLIKKEVLFSVMWGTGYTVMWLGKWLLAWLFTGFNYFKEALQQAERYTSDHATWEEVNPTLADRLMKNISMYLKWPFVLLVLAVLLLAVLLILKERKRITKEKVIGILPYVPVALLPFAVFVVLGNGYSYVHYWFTHRLLAISAFAGISMVLQLTEKRDR